MRFTKHPKIDRQTGKQIGWRYKFWRYNPENKRNEPVPVAELPGKGAFFDDDEAAKAYCSIKSAEEDAVKARIEQRLAWKTKFYEFPALIEEFAKAHQHRAPNSWQNDVHWLESYVLHFFLDIKAANNVNNWPLYYEEFTNWLRSIKPLKYRKDQLALNSANKAIKALNLFLGFLARRGQCQEMAKCPVFPKHQLKRSDAADVLEESEIQSVLSALQEIRPASADLFLVMVRTGLRINEALGVCLPFLNEGRIQGRKSARIHEALVKYDLGDYRGFICLESQPALEELRSESGAVPRKPLKHRKSIDPRWFRYVPVFDDTAWAVLARRANAQIKAFGERRYGEELRAYLLFDGLTASMFYSDLQKAFARTRIRPRGPHKLRHTYLTWFYDAVSDDSFLAEVVAGHRDKAIMEVYSHGAEQRGREALARQGLKAFNVV